MDGRNPPGSGRYRHDRGWASIAAQTQATSQELAGLSAEVEALRTQRDELASRLDALESNPPVGGAFALSTTETGDGSSGDATSSSVPTNTEAHIIDGEESPLFTDGADRYNCRDFTSYDEAQEALHVNRPGDPNRIDMNGNNVACEDFRYPAAARTP
ncbi:MAG: hypothetical protein O2924_01435 [Chloroflexi bacterium]|nr:hypothetical protein [Chloroflexota bacterium]